MNGTRVISDIASDHQRLEDYSQRLIFFRTQAHCTSGYLPAFRSVGVLAGALVVGVAAFGGPTVESRAGDRW